MLWPFAGWPFYYYGVREDDFNDKLEYEEFYARIALYIDNID